MVLVLREGFVYGVAESVSTLNDLSNDCAEYT